MITNINIICNLGGAASYIVSIFAVIYTFIDMSKKLEREIKYQSINLDEDELSALYKRLYNNRVIRLFITIFTCVVVSAVFYIINKTPFVGYEGLITASICSGIVFTALFLCFILEYNSKLINKYEITFGGQKPGRDNKVFYRISMIFSLIPVFLGLHTLMLTYNFIFLFIQ